MEELLILSPVLVTVAGGLFAGNMVQVRDRARLFPALFAIHRIEIIWIDVIWIKELIAGQLSQYASQDESRDDI